MFDSDGPVKEILAEVRSGQKFILYGAGYDQHILNIKEKETASADRAFQFQDWGQHPERGAPNSLNQIFVGNLPEYADLKALFSSYGNVVHVKCNPKNFAFVVFDNEGPVQKILGEVCNGKKFMLYGQHLNIKAKKSGSSGALKEWGGIQSQSVKLRTPSRYL